MTVKQNYSFKMETVDPKPRGGSLCEGICAGQTTTSWTFFVGSLSLFFTHSFTPLHALASGCLEPSGRIEGERWLTLNELTKGITSFFARLLSQRANTYS